MKFRKKPEVVEAFQWFSSTSQSEMPGWALAKMVRLEGPPRYVIPTLEGAMAVSHGDWVIQGVLGEVYPCKPDVFAATYESVYEGPGWRHT